MKLNIGRAEDKEIVVVVKATTLTMSRDFQWAINHIHSYIHI